MDLPPLCSPLQHLPRAAARETRGSWGDLLTAPWVPTPLEPSFTANLESPAQAASLPADHHVHRPRASSALPLAFELATPVSALQSLFPLL